MRQELLKRLEKVQNTVRFMNQDIMTFTGFLNENELIKYVEEYEGMVA